MSSVQQLILSGFADEANPSLEKQIEAHRELGWRWLDLRKLRDSAGKPQNVSDLPLSMVEEAAAAIAEAGMAALGYGSNLGNYNHPATEPFEVTLEELQRLIPRAQALKAHHVRIMSYALPARGEPLQEEERFRRLREIVGRCRDAGLLPLHENCGNYGGLGWRQTMKMLENVPGLRLIFDTANQVKRHDPTRDGETYPRPNWEFYEQVRDWVDVLHIKDRTREARHCWPGEGEGEVGRIVADWLSRPEPGPISIEPHIKGNLPAELKSDPAQADAWRYDHYVEYGRRFTALLRRLG